MNASSRILRTKATRTTLIIGALSLLFLVRDFCSGQEYFTKIAGTTLGGKPLSVAAFGSAFYIGVENESDPSSNKLLRTTNGTTWEALAFPAQLQVTGLVEHKGYLYAFAVDQQSTPANYVYRSLDGTSWSVVDNGQFSGGWNGPASFQNHIYVEAGASGVWRTVGSGSPLWEQVQNFPAVAWGHHLAVFNGKLYAGGLVNLPITESRVYQSSDGLSWNLSNTFTVPNGHEVNVYHGFSKTDRHLYWGHAQLSKTNGTTWSTVASLVPSVLYPSLPFALFDRAYFDHYNGVHVLSDQDVATRVADALLPEDPYVPTQSATIGNTALLIADELYVIKKGVISLEALGTSASALTPGQQEVELLKIRATVNIEERINGLTIGNTGTAIAGTDIQAVSIYRSGTTREKLTDLTAQASGLAWKLGTYEFSLTDSQDLIVVANIAASATNAKTCRFSLTELQWLNAPSFQFSSVTSPQQQTITAADPVLLNDVQIAPVPARDRISFVYDLLSPGEALIKIFNRNGDLVTEIEDRDKPAGYRQVTRWDSSSAAPGVYLAVIEVRPALGEAKTYRKKVYIEK